MVRRWCVVRSVCQVGREGKKKVGENQRNSGRANKFQNGRSRLILPHTVLPWQCLNVHIKYTVAVPHEHVERKLLDAIQSVL